MLNILAITAPIYLIIALGSTSVWAGIFKREHMGVLGMFLLKVSLPCLIFRAISQYRLHEVLNLDYLGVYAMASLLTFGCGLAYGRYLCRHDRSRSALYGQGMAASNSVFIGYPIAQPLLGSAADIALSLCLLVEIVLIIPLTMAIADSGGDLRWYRSLQQSLKTLFKSPVFLGILFGLTWSAAGASLPAPLQKTLALLSGAAAPVALFMIGGMLVGQPIRGWGKELSALAIGKLLLHPLMTFAMLAVMPNFDPRLQTAALLFACMPIPLLLPALAQKYNLAGFCSAALVLATLLSFITINSWLVALPFLMHWII